MVWSNLDCSKEQFALLFDETSFTSDPLDG